MQVNAIQIGNYNNKNNQPSFGIIECKGAKENLARVFSSGELKEFANLVNKHKGNELVEITLFAKGKKKFAANVSNNLSGDDYVCKPYSQMFYESPMRFFKRVIKVAEKVTEHVQEVLKKQELIDKLS